MPLADWCAKLAHCVDPESHILPHAHSDRQRHTVVRTTPVATEVVVVAATPTSATTTHSTDTTPNGVHVNVVDNDNDDDTELLNSGSTLVCSSNSNDDDDDDRSLPTTSRRLSALVQRHRHRLRVPSISITSLYNKLQTTGVVVIDCRDTSDFVARHLPSALHCPYVKGGKKKTVDDVLALAPADSALVQRLAKRDLIEVVVIPATAGSSRRHVLGKTDWGYRVARLLVSEGRVFSVRFLSQGFARFANTYAFLLTTASAKDDDNAVQHAQQPLAPVAAPAAGIQSYPNEILEGFVYLGNYWHATSPRVLADLEITHVLNVGAPTTDRIREQSVAYLDFVLPDKVDADITRDFAAAIAFIDGARRTNSHARVLIHCIQGVSRSATIAIWYVLQATHCSLSAAYAHVLKCRPLVFPNHGFMQQLIASETALYGTASVSMDDIDRLQNGLLQASDRASSQLRESFSV